MAGFLAAGMKAIRLPGMLATHQHYRWLVTSHHPDHPTRYSCGGSTGITPVSHHQTAAPNVAALPLWPKPKLRP